MRSIALIGLSGVGKSTVGRALAAQLGLPFVDTDRLLEAQAAISIPDMFALHGETFFRDLEACVLAEALEAQAVIATGGGMILRAANRALLRERAVVIWLDAPTDALVARLQAHDEERPLLHGDIGARLDALRAARAELYAATAHLQINTQQHTPNIVAEICGYLDAMTR